MAMTNGPVSTLDDLIELLSQPVAWRCISGELRHRHDDGSWTHQRIFMTDNMYRVEEDARGLVVIRGAHHYWLRSDRDCYDFPLVHEGRWEDFAASMLARRLGLAYWEAWLVQDPRLVMSSLAGVDHLGRRALRFSLPETAGGRVSVTMDLETGFILQAVRDDIGVVDEWASFSTRPLDPALFEGPIHP
jgi:hypothetical protein